MEVKKGLGIFKEKNGFILAVKREQKRKKKKKILIAQVCTYYKAVIYRNEAKTNSLATTDIV